VSDGSGHTPDPAGDRGKSLGEIESIYAEYADWFDRLDWLDRLLAGRSAPTGAR